MSKNYILKWSGGEIKISSLGCMMVPKFKLGDKYIEPLHSANWINDRSHEYNSLPGILKQLSGEFPCVPFGINSPVEQLSSEWSNCYSEEPYVINEPHGYAANNDWESTEISDQKIKFKIFYPQNDNVDYLIRTIEVNENEIHKIKCSLEIAVKKDCSLPIGLHPMIKIPSKKNKIKIIPGNFKFGLTYPGLVLSEKTLGAIGKEFTTIENVPGFQGSDVNISQPPLEGNYEDLFQLCGIDGNMMIENYEDNYRLKYSWNPDHFTSVLMWLSNKGREEYPWNSSHVTFGLEPITSAFGLSTHVSNNLTNPIHSRGVPTSLKFLKNQNWKTEYYFFVEKI